MTTKEQADLMEKRALELYHICIALGSRSKNITPHSLGAIRRKTAEIRAIAENMEWETTKTNTLRDYLMNFGGVGV
jgi:hypothetical protein